MINSSTTLIKNARESSFLGVAVIILLTIVVYIPAIHGGFVFDDTHLITNNPMIKAANGLHRFWLTTEAPDYWPLTSTVWWLEWRLWGNNPTGYHVVNILVHAVNAVLVWFILRRLKIPGAWLATLLFAVHPVNVATVGWISEQKNTLSMLFFTTAILCYLWFDEENRWRWYTLSLAAFVLALLSKTAVVMLPVVLLACLWWLHGRVRWTDFFRVGPLLIISLIFGFVTLWVQYTGEAEGSTTWMDDLARRLVIAGCTPWFYVYKTFLPLNLSAIYPKWEINSSRWASYMPGAALVVCFMIFWWKRKTWGRPLLFAFMCFIAMLFPVSGFFRQSFHQFSFVADHWQYVFIVAPIALSVAAGQLLVNRMGQQGRDVAMLAVLVALVTLAATTWARASVYRTDESLWRDTIAKNPDAPAAHYNLAVNLAHSGNLEEAVGHYEQALRLKHDYAIAYNELGVALIKLGRIQDAIKNYEQALLVKPDYAMAHNNLGVALEQVGRVADAIEHYEQALRFDSNLPEAHYSLGAALWKTGNTQSAINHFEQALRIKPNYPEVHYDLAIVLEAVDKREDAAAHYRRAVALADTDGNQELADAARNRLKLNQTNSSKSDKQQLSPDN